jgi:hypothetical protein
MRPKAKCSSKKAEIMTRRLFGVLAAIAIAVLGFCAPSLPPAIAQVQQVTGGPISQSATGPMLVMDISGQSTCRLSLGGTWVANVKAMELAVGGSLYGPLNLYDDQHIKYVAGATGDDDYIFYPQSAGTIKINVGTYTSGTVVLNSLNCSPGGAAPPDTDANGYVPVAIYSAFPGAIPIPTPSAFPWPILPSPTAFTLPQMPGVLAYNVCAVPSASPSPPALGSTSSVAAQCDSHGNWLVDVAAALPGVFPTPQPFATLPGNILNANVNTPAPVLEVTAVPSCPPTQYPCGQPTPQPLATNASDLGILVHQMNTVPATTPSAGPLPTASAGATPPPAAPWLQSVLDCQYNGEVGSAAPASPSPTAGNLIPCQANPNGLPIFALPVLRAQIVAAATGTYLPTILEGESNCRLQMVPTVGSTGTVQVLDSNSNVFAGPYSISGAGTTATFQLVTNSYVVGDALSVQITALTGTSITLKLTCTSAAGGGVVYQGGSWSTTIANPTAFPSPIPYQSFSGLVLKSALSDTGGTAWTPSSPLPVHDFIPVQPSPLYTAPVHDAAPVQPSPLYTTPVSTPSAAPAPTASAGGAPPAQAPQTNAQMLCYFVSGNVALSNGNSFAVKCDKMGNLSVTSAGRSNTPATAAVSTCTAADTGPELLVDITYASASAQTGTLEIFNEGASPTCAAIDLMWVSVAHAAGGMETINRFASAGIAYEWLTNAAVGRVLIDTNP